ncbi:MAG: lytic transglycosylase domain-containing protein [Candidatus Latescibacteria bacterium]|nr:lytic transglycosylase domain-containing protein [Candidatus Latescibacterota bacterium]
MILKFRMNSPCFSSSVKKRFVIIFNMVVFVTAIFLINLSINNAADRVEIVVGGEIDTEKEVKPPYDAALPHITIPEKKDVFEFLRIDSSIVEPENLVQSISPWEQHIQQYSEEYNVDSDLVRAIIYTESNGDPYKISHAGALGLMQIMPLTADFMGISNMLDPEENIKAGVKYIAWLVKQYDEPHMLWAWNAGPNRIRKNQMPGETKRFIENVLSIKSYLKDERNNAI